MTTLHITLPDALAREAATAGLLSPEGLERLLREQLRARHLAGLREARARLAADPLPALTAEEIAAEIAAWRAGLPRAAGA